MTGQQRRATPHRTTPTAAAPRPRSSLLFWVLLTLPCGSFAATTLDVSADYQHQSNSNIWDLAPGAPPIFHPNDPKRGDSYNAYGGTLAAGFVWSRQSITVNIEGHDYQYQHFTDLNHEEYQLAADWNWAIGPILDGSLGATRSRDMVPFYDYIGTQIGNQQIDAAVLSIQTTQAEHLKFNIHVGADWRLATSLNTSQSNSPRPGLPNLSLREDTAQESLLYTGQAGLTAGLAAQYVRGSYSGVDQNVLIASGVDVVDPHYHQYGVQFTANYSLNPASSFNGAVGYSKRSSENGIDNLSGITGSIAYLRNITAKTRIKLELSRVINSYITNAGSEIDSSGSFQIDWQATRKISLNARYSYTYSELPNQGINGTDRVDHFRIGQIGIDYKPFKWLEFGPYARWETRTSAVSNFEYSTNIYGINGYLRWQNGASALAAPGARGR
jgi:hypothetical protein